MGEPIKTYGYGTGFCVLVDPNDKSRMIEEPTTRQMTEEEKVRYGFIGKPAGKRPVYLGRGNDIKNRTKMPPDLVRKKNLTKELLGKLLGEGMTPEAIADGYGYMPSAVRALQSRWFK